MWLAGAGVQPRGLVAQLAGTVLEAGEELAGDSLPAIFRSYVHALELAGVVGQRLDAAAAHPTSIRADTDQKVATGRGELGRPRLGHVDGIDVEIVVEVRHLGAHGVEQRHRGVALLRCSRTSAAPCPL